MTVLEEFAGIQMGFLESPTEILPAKPTKCSSWSYCFFRDEIGTKPLAFLLWFPFRANGIFLLFYMGAWHTSCPHPSFAIGLYPSILIAFSLDF